jgi:hypothetical protein
MLHKAACSTAGTRWCRTAAVTLLLALCGAGAVPALARSNYDGDWSVLITTQQGACDPVVRYGVEIDNGVVSSPDSGPAVVQGRVSPRGDVRVSVQAGNQWASGSGRLNFTRGGGEWQGQGSSGVCYGTWLAERRSYGTAQYGVGQRRYYNYYNDRY